MNQPIGNADRLTRILFVVGMNESTSKVYRVFNRVIHLNWCGDFIADSIHYESSDLDRAVPCYDLICLYRTQMNPAISRVIQAAKSYGKILIFDADDRIFHPDQIQDIPFISGFSADHRQVYLNLSSRLFEVFQECDFFTASTPQLVAEGEKLGKKSYLLRNSLHPYTVEATRFARQLHLKARSDTIRLGYFSGSNTHDQDFQEITESLIEILKRFSQVRLVLSGSLSLPQELRSYSKQIETIPLCDETLFPLIKSAVDINLAPLHQPDNLFQRGKSEVKLIEAAVAGIPTVCSPMQNYLHFLGDTAPSFVAKTKNDWVERLEPLIKSQKNYDDASQAFQRLVGPYLPEQACLETGAVYREISTSVRNREGKNPLSIPTRSRIRNSKSVRFWPGWTQPGMKKPLLKKPEFLNIKEKGLFYSSLDLSLKGEDCAELLFNSELRLLSVYEQSGLELFKEINLRSEVLSRHWKGKCHLYWGRSATDAEARLARLNLKTWGDLPKDQRVLAGFLDQKNLRLEFLDRESGQESYLFPLLTESPENADLWQSAWDLITRLFQIESVTVLKDHSEGRKLRQLAALNGVQFREQLKFEPSYILAADQVIRLPVVSDGKINIGIITDHYEKPAFELWHPLIENLISIGFRIFWFIVNSEKNSAQDKYSKEDLNRLEANGVHRIECRQSELWKLAKDCELSIGLQIETNEAGSSVYHYEQAGLPVILLSGINQAGIDQGSSVQETSYGWRLRGNQPGHFNKNSRFIHEITRDAESIVQAYLRGKNTTLTSSLPQTGANRCNLKPITHSI